MELVKEKTAWVQLHGQMGQEGLLQLSPPMLMNSNFDFVENYCWDGLSPLLQDLGLGAQVEGQQW